MASVESNEKPFNPRPDELRDAEPIVVPAAGRNSDLRLRPRKQREDRDESSPKPEDTPGPTQQQAGEEKLTSPPASAEVSDSLAMELVAGIADLPPSDSTDQQSGTAEPPSMAPDGEYTTGFSFRDQTHSKDKQIEDDVGAGRLHTQADDPLRRSFIATLLSMVLFLAGNIFLCFSVFGLGNPLTRFNPVTISGILAAQLVFLVLALPARRPLHHLSRTLVGALTLFSAMAAVLALLVNSLFDPMFAYMLVERLPSAPLTAVSTFLFAGSLALLARGRGTRWVLALLCLLAAVVVPAVPFRQIMASRETVAGRFALLASDIAMPEQWHLVDKQGSTKEGKQIRYRHRIAPLEATVTTPPKRWQIKPPSVLEAGRRLRADYQSRPGTFACMLSAVREKPHQMKLVSMGEETTAVLIIRTRNGIKTLAVSGRRDIYERYEDQVNQLFAGIN